jgi:hypothetical protein
MRGAQDSLHSARSQAGGTRPANYVRVSALAARVVSLSAQVRAAATSFEIDCSRPVNGIGSETSAAIRCARAYARARRSSANSMGLLRVCRSFADRFDELPAPVRQRSRAWLSFCTVQNGTSVVASEIRSMGVSKSHTCRPPTNARIAIAIRGHSHAHLSLSAARLSTSACPFEVVVAV